MSDTISSEPSQPRKVVTLKPSPGTCLYCHGVILADEAHVRGVKAVAHRRCVREEILANLRARHAGHAISARNIPLLTKSFAECGFTFADVFE